MKLLYYVNRNFFIFLLFLVGIWGVLFYFAIIEEVIDETDDRLENIRDIVVGKALMNPEILNSNDSVIQIYIFRPISPEKARKYKERFYDSTMYIESEDEWEPVRVMKSSFLASNGNFYEIEIRMSTLEREDMIEAIFTYLTTLYVLLMICIVIGNKILLQKALTPLHRLLKWFDQIMPGEPVPPLNNETKISEFKKLNAAAWAMSTRSEKAYQEQKCFIENASHELQTPLAIALGKLELLAEEDCTTKKQLIEIDEVYQTLNRAVRLNKALLLLSRISNSQYQETQKINLNELINSIVHDLEEVYNYKNINLSVAHNHNCMVTMNENLAQILFTNLIKNSIVHNTENGNVSITIMQNSLSISNSGSHPLDDKRLFQRFYRAQDSKSESSNGLGLSIVKSITDLYNIRISYNYIQGQHTFLLSFPTIRFE